METENKNSNSNISGFLLLPVFVVILAVFVIYYLFFVLSNQTTIKNSEAVERNYHIIVTGSSENELFLKQVYEGASNFGDYFDSVVELYVPSSQAEDVSTQSLFDYASFVNADCVIAYIDSLDNSFQIPRRVDDTPIPLVTTGQYDPNLPQISFIGNSNWALGKKISDETVSLLNDSGKAYFISKEIFTSSSLSSLVNSIQDSLRPHNNISYSIADSISQEELVTECRNNKTLLVCLSEEDTIEIAQTLIELKLADNKKMKIIGFGNNETSQLYLDKGIINELISLDPEKIGETAIKEFFEYRNKGYANSYIAADVKITRSRK